MAAKNHPELGSFPSTQWSLIYSARAEDSARRRAALNKLLPLYLPALRMHILYRLRIEYHRAEDLLHEFVVRQVLERDLLAKADEARGRFRSFLLKSFRNFVFTELRAAGKRQGAELDFEPPDRAACDEFEAEWARQLLRAALRRMKRECADDGETVRWDLFTCRVLLPTLTDNAPPAYATLIGQFGFRTPEQASNALVNSKRHFARTLRAVIAETENMATDAEIDAEIADLRTTLQKAGDLGLEWDRVLITGPQGREPESFPAVIESVDKSINESNPSELAGLLSVRGTAEGNWDPAELGDLLRHCLSAPASEYLRGVAGTIYPSAEFAADSPSEHAAAGMPLGELLHCADPPLGLLIAVKTRARRLTSPGTSDVPVEIHQVVYFAAIAAALVRHGELISKSGPDVLRIGWERLGGEAYVEEGLRRLFEAAVSRVGDEGLGIRD